ncbi:hypothetical protein ACWEGV_37590, partial [Streptomyces sp. NPDC004976]
PEAALRVLDDIALEQLRAFPVPRVAILGAQDRDPETVVAALHADDISGQVELDRSEALEFTTVLALGLATASPGGLVMRTSRPGTPDRVHGWRLRAYGLEPLTAGEVFDAYCTDAESGDLIAPESNVDYCEPPDLGEEGGPSPAHDH